MLSRITDFFVNYKSASALVVALFSSPILDGFAKYVVGELTVGWFILVMIIIDTALGFWVAFRVKNVSSTKFSRVFEKLIIYMALLSATFALSSTLKGGMFEVIAVETRQITVAFIVIREFISIIEKASKLGYGVPVWIKDKLADQLEEKSKNAG